MNIRMLLAASFLLLVFPSSSAGQARSGDPRATSPLRLGPLYITPAISITDLGIDTNVFNADADRKRDFTVAVLPKLVLAVPFAQRGVLTLSTAADVVYYKEYASERSVNPSATLRGELYLNRVTLFVAPSYLRTRQRPNFEIDLRSRREEQGVAVGVDVRVTPKLSVELSGREVRTTYDLDAFFLGTNLAEALNQKSSSAGIATKWAVTPLTTLTLRSELAQDRFQTSQFRNADTQRITAGVQLKPQALVSGSAEIGVRILNTLDARLPNFTGLVAAAGLSYRLLESTLVGVSISRDSHYSFEPLQPYFIDTSTGISVRRQLGGRFDATVGYDRHRYRYRNLASIAADTNPVTRMDITTTSSAGVGYRVGGTGRLGVGVVYWSRDSNERDYRNYNGLRFGSTFSYGL